MITTCVAPLRQYIIPDILLGPARRSGHYLVSFGDLSSARSSGRSHGRLQAEAVKGHLFGVKDFRHNVFLLGGESATWGDNTPMNLLF